MKKICLTTICSLFTRSSGHYQSFKITLQYVTVKVAMVSAIVGYPIKGVLSRGASEYNRFACFEIITCGTSDVLKEPPFRKLSNSFYVGS